MSPSRNPAISVRTLALVITFFALVHGSADAQSSREQLIAQGAKAVSAANLKQLLSGMQISGTPMEEGGGSWSQWVLKEDGSYSGWISDARDNKFEGWGKWSINGKGQLCMVQVMYGTELCSDWYKLGDDYFAVVGTNAARRSIKKPQSSQ